MIIPHPLLGPRDAAEFTYLGDASMLLRPDPATEQNPDKLMKAFHDYVHLRDNPAGIHKELWFHEQGDRSWLVVTRHVSTHEIISVELASDVKKASKRKSK
ncbi:MAG: sarcosine oxidase subunit delta [Candidatus Puniceispirillales bacterium]|nr:sarcosine oxidase subunit delta [Pseudomonadota bacterium]